MPHNWGLGTSCFALGLKTDGPVRLESLAAAKARGSEYQIFEVSGSENHTLMAFGTRGLKYRVLAPSGKASQGFRCLTLERAREQKQLRELSLIMAREVW